MGLAGISIKISSVLHARQCDSPEPGGSETLDPKVDPKDVIIL